MDNSHLKGIGGWLILLLVGMIFAIIYSALFLINLIQTDLNLIQKAFITYITGAYHPAYGAWLLYEVILNIVVIIFILCLLILMLKKSRFFPIITIVYLIAVILLHVIDYILGFAILYNIGYTPSLTGVIQSLIIAIVTIPYLLFSKRVKATFVNKNLDRQSGSVNI